MFGNENIKNIRNNFKCDFGGVINLEEMNDNELENLVDELWNDFYDERRKLDENLLVCRFPSVVDSLYRARVLEAESKFYYAKYYRDMRYKAKHNS